MPALSNPRRENFAQALARGTKQIDAYAGAGFKRDTSASAKAARLSDVAGRVAELVAEKNRNMARATEKAIERAAVTEEWIITRLKYVVESGLRGTPELDKNGVQTGRFTGKPDRAAATRALELLGKTKGMFIDRHEFGRPGDFAALTDEDLAAKITEMGSSLGIPPKVLETMVNGTKH